MINIEEKFHKGDCIISHSSGDMAIYDKVDKNGYMHFKFYYNAMFHKLYDVKTYIMQINYQSFYELCNEGEKQKLDNIIKG